jgi:hypothetical protein
VERWKEIKRGKGEEDMRSKNERTGRKELMILINVKEKDEKQELKVGSFKRCENILERGFSLKNGLKNI